MLSFFIRNTFLTLAAAVAFAVLVAGPMFRVKERSAELAKIMTREIARHLEGSDAGVAAG